MATQRKGLNRVPGTTVTKPEVDFPPFDGLMATEAVAMRRVVDALVRAGVPKQHLASVLHSRLRGVESAGQCRDVLHTWANDLNN